MPLPIDNLTTLYLDAGTDDPSQARVELLAAINKLKEVIAVLDDGAGSGLNADLLDGVDSVLYARRDADYSGHPVSGYVRGGTGVYFTSAVPSLTALSSGILTSIPAPAGAKGLILSIRTSAVAAGAGGFVRQGSVEIYSNAAGTIIRGIAEITILEYTGAASGFALGSNTAEFISPVVSNNAYVKLTSGNASYRVVGYTV